MLNKLKRFLNYKEYWTIFCDPIHFSDKEVLDLPTTVIKTIPLEIGDKIDVHGFVFVVVSTGKFAAKISFFSNDDLSKHENIFQLNNKELFKLVS